MNYTYITEALELLEAKVDIENLENHVGKETADKFMEMRKKFKSPYNDIHYWLKQDPQELADYLDSYQSNSQSKKDAKKGMKLVASEDGDKLYQVSTYDAMKYIGRGTTWCLAGNYAGHEEEGQKWFDYYMNERNLDPYYYVLVSSDDKFCIHTVDDRLVGVWNANQSGVNAEGGFNEEEIEDFVDNHPIVNNLNNSPITYLLSVQDVGIVFDYISSLNYHNGVMNGRFVEHVLDYVVGDDTKLYEIYVSNSIKIDYDEVLYMLSQRMSQHNIDRIIKLAMDKYGIEDVTDLSASEENGIDTSDFCYRVKFAMSSAIAFHALKNAYETIIKYMSDVLKIDTSDFLGSGEFYYTSHNVVYNYEGMSGIYNEIGQNGIDNRLFFPNNGFDDSWDTEEFMEVFLNY